jgi:hypothetical protein
MYYVFVTIGHAIVFSCGRKAKMRRTVKRWNPKALHEIFVFDVTVMFGSVMRIHHSRGHNNNDGFFAVHENKNDSVSLILMPPPRPRLLYTATFAWLAVTGGRFLAPFLEHEASFTDTMIGIVLATQCAVSSVLGSAGGSWADARERSFPARGRAQVMFTGIVLGSTAFLLHGACHFFPPGWTFLSSPEWHFFLRILWAFSSCLILPVLDGMTLAHLQKTPGMSHSDYGKERLYGAVSWAIVNILVGPVLDCFGFIVLYPFAMIVTVLSFISIAIYVNGQGLEDSHQSMSQSIEPADAAPNKDLHWNKGTSPNVPMWALVRILTSTFYGVGFLFTIGCLSMGTSVVESLVFMFFEFLMNPT